MVKSRESRGGESPFRLFQVATGLLVASFCQGNLSGDLVLIVLLWRQLPQNRMARLCVGQRGHCLGLVLF